MSQFDDQTDFEILDLLYEELDEAGATLKKKLEQDPWQRLECMDGQL